MNCKKNHVIHSKSEVFWLGFRTAIGLVGKRATEYDVDAGIYINFIHVELCNWFKVRLGRWRWSDDVGSTSDNLLSTWINPIQEFQIYVNVFWATTLEKMIFWKFVDIYDRFWNNFVRCNIYKVIRYMYSLKFNSWKPIFIM